MGVALTVVPADLFPLVSTVLTINVYSVPFVKLVMALLVVPFGTADVGIPDADISTLAKSESGGAVQLSVAWAFPTVATSAVTSAGAVVSLAAAAGVVGFAHPPKDSIATNAGNNKGAFLIPSSC